MKLGGSALIEAVTGWIYPNCCQLCGEQRATRADGYICPKCWGGLRFIPPPFCRRCGLPFPGEITQDFECANCRDLELHFEFARAAVVADGVALEVIHRFKYQRALWFEPFLADLLGRVAAATLVPGEWQLVVPVPLHPVREREREFNQAGRLAGCLAERLGLIVRNDLVQRREATRTQTKLSREERAENVRRAFAPGAGPRLNGENVVVVDDVLTTGATTNAVARVLRQLGAGRVAVLTVARATLEHAALPGE